MISEMTIGPMAGAALAPPNVLIDCATKCVKEKGAKWALYDPKTKATFVLSGDDAMFLKMAATEVTVKGTMDKEKKTITVVSMENMPAK